MVAFIAATVNYTIVFIIYVSYYNTVFSASVKYFIVNGQVYAAVFRPSVVCDVMYYVG